MPVGAGSLKRTAKSVSTPKTEETKSATKTTTTRKKPAAATATVKKEEQPESTSGIKCELPVYLL